MKGWYGPAIFCYSLSWLFFLPVFSTPNFLYGFILICIGGILSIFATHSIKPMHISRKYIIFLIIGILGLSLVPFPFNIGSVFFILSGVFAIVKTWAPFSYSAGLLSIGLLFSGGILFFQAMIYPLYVFVVCQGHRIDVISPILSFFLNTLGLPASVNHGLVFIQTSQQTFPLTVTLEKIGFLPFLMYSVGLLFLILVLYRKRDWWKPLFWFFLFSGLFLFIRLLLIIQLFIAADDLSVFWDPIIFALSFIPFGMIMFWYFNYSWGTVDYNLFHRFRWNRRLSVSCVLLVLFCIMMIGFVGYHDPGDLKPGRVMIDEVHSEWEDSIRPLDTEWFGLLSTYNYYSWVEWMNESYILQRNVDHLLVEDVLKDIDILILKCPTTSYNEEEISEISHFVKRGGGLWLIGDHTDVFGMNTFLNQFYPEFGIRFRNDATYELGTGNMTIFSRPAWFQHPIIYNVPKVEFMTSCTLEAPWGAENVIIGSHMSAEPGTYATENFFRDSIVSAEAEFGLFLQMVALKYGKGRVVAFSDSTVFSSFSVFSDGYQSLTIGTLDYLNRMNSQPPSSFIFLFIAFVLGSIGIGLLWHQQKQAIFLVVIVAIMIGITGGLSVITYLNNEFWISSDFDIRGDEIVFDFGHTSSRVNLHPTVSIFEETDNFGTLYVWSQRVGLTPRMVNSLDAGILDAECVVFINPSKTFNDRELSLLNNFIDAGGSLLLFDSIQNVDSTINEVIGRFGLWVYVDHELSELSINQLENNSTIGNISRPVIRISGGDILGITDNNKSLIRGVDLVNESTGAVGRVVVVIDSYSFSNKVLGGPLTEPNKDQLALFNTIFYLYNHVME